MEVTESMVYWITRLDGIKVALITPIILAAIGTGISVITWFAGMDTEDKKAVILGKAMWLVSLFLWILAAVTIFIPTTKEMCAIKVLPIIANNENVQELPDKVVDLANEWLDELKPKSVIEEKN